MSSTPIGRDAAETEAEHGLRMRTAERAHAGHEANVASGFAPLVAMGHDILKAVAFLNGGAAIATIGLMAAALHDSPSLARAIVTPLAAFGFGLTVAACATGWSYVSQARYAAAVRARDTAWREPFIRDTDASREATRSGDRFQTLAMGAVFVSIGSAIFGFCAAGVVLLVMLR